MYSGYKVREGGERGIWKRQQDHSAVIFGAAKVDVGQSPGLWWERGLIDGRLSSGDIFISGIPAAVFGRGRYAAEQQSPHFASHASAALNYYCILLVVIYWEWRRANFVFSCLIRLNRWNELEKRLRSDASWYCFCVTGFVRLEGKSHPRVLRIVWEHNTAWLHEAVADISGPLELASRSGILLEERMWTGEMELLPVDCAVLLLLYYYFTSVRVCSGI